MPGAESSCRMWLAGVGWRGVPPDVVWKHGRVLDDVVPTLSSAPSRRRPLVIAHRGSSLAEPEHTLRAYVRAIDEGADALECDVRLTADSHLVCVHDRRVNRTS